MTTIDRDAALRVLARLEAGERIGVTIGNGARPDEIAIVGAFAEFVREIVAANLKAIVDGDPPDNEPQAMQMERTGT